MAKKKGKKEVQEILAIQPAETKISPLGAVPKAASDASLIGSYPERPAVHRLPLDLNGGRGSFKFAPGVYIVAGGTGSGKSLNMLALHARIMREIAAPSDPSIDSSTYRAAYWNVFEPTSKFNMLPGTVNSIEAVNAFMNDGFYFLNDPAVIEKRGATDKRCDFVKLVERARVAGAQRQPATFVIFDSVTDAVEKFAPDLRAGQRTFKGGTQPADADFFRTLHRKAVAANMIVFAVLNSDVMPVTPAFEGVVEGIAVSVRPGTLSLKGRADGRLPRVVSFSPAELNLVAPLLGYTDETASSGAGSRINIGAI